MKRAALHLQGPEYKQTPYCQASPWKDKREAGVGTEAAMKTLGSQASPHMGAQLSGRDLHFTDLSFLYEVEVDVPFVPWSF